MKTPHQIHPAALRFWVEKSIELFSETLLPGMQISAEGTSELRKAFSAYYNQIPASLFPIMASGYHELLKAHLISCVLHGPFISICPSRCCCGGVFLPEIIVAYGLGTFPFSKN